MTTNESWEATKPKIVKILLLFIMTPIVLGGYSYTLSSFELPLSISLFLYLLVALPYFLGAVMWMCIIVGIIEIKNTVNAEAAGIS